MAEKLRVGAIALAMQVIAFGLCAAEMPQHDAPFGLRFGMSAGDVRLPLSPPPEAPKKRPQPPSFPQYGLYPPLFPSEEERREQREYEVQRDARESLLKGCARSFDSPFRANYDDDSWVEWTSARSTRGELYDLSPYDILERSQVDLYRRFKEQVDGRGFPQPEAFRSVSIHTVKAAGTDRDVCLIFTEHGLTHVYAPQNALEDVIKEIYGRLSANSDYEQYSSRRIRQGGSMEETLGWRLVTERRVWLDKSRKIMVAAKHTDVHEGLVGRAKTAFLKDDFADGLPPYIAYTDLGRRGQTFARYGEKTLPVLTAAIRDAFEADEAAKRRKDGIERAKRDRENSDRKGLIESFR